MPRDIRVLLVEDNPGDARLIHEMLLRATYEKIDLTWVATLYEGLEYVHTQPCDVVLLDLSLPDSTGFDTLTKIASAVDIPVIVLTGLQDEAIGLQAVQHGAQDYLPKGDVSSPILLRAIRYAIERHHTDAALRRSESAYRSLINDVFDTSMVAVIIVERSYRVVWCNKITEEYFGISRERIIGRDKRQLIDEELKCVFDDPDTYAQHLLKAYETWEFTDRFECHVLPNGERAERWLEHWSQPIRDGLYAGGRIAQYTDITARKRLEIAEREQRSYAEAMRDIAMSLIGTLNLHDVLQRILSNLDQVVPHDLASIALLEENQLQVASYQVHTQDDPKSARDWQMAPEYRQYLDVMLYTRQPVVIVDLQPDEATPVPGLLRAFVGAPIMLHQEIIGFLNLFSRIPGFFTKVHSERLMAFAGMAGIALQNARMYEQSRTLATMEERQRLARELHDSVSQTIFTARNMAETVVRRWDRDPAGARELMNEVLQLSSTALIEMRVLLLELRPSTLADVTMKKLFEQYLQPIQERRQFELTMNIDDIPPLPPDVQIALYRITQEALNNIDKHAQAKQVEVQAILQPGYIELIIRDDGRGFNTEENHVTSLGLNIMQERAADIGAVLDIQSQIGVGTSIRVIWHYDTNDNF